MKRQTLFQLILYISQLQTIRERQNTTSHRIFLQHLMQKLTNLEKVKNIFIQKVRQCHYCNNHFVKSFEKLQKHISCCSGKAGFEFSFDNGKLIIKIIIATQETFHFQSTTTLKPRQVVHFFLFVCLFVCFFCFFLMLRATV